MKLTIIVKQQIYWRDADYSMLLSAIHYLRYTCLFQCLLKMLSAKDYETYKYNNY